MEDEYDTEDIGLEKAAVGREATAEKPVRDAGCFVLVLPRPTKAVRFFLTAAPGPGPKDGNSSRVTLPTAVRFNLPLPAALRTPSAVHPTKPMPDAAPPRVGNASLPLLPPPSVPSRTRILAACALNSAVRAACIGSEISGSFSC